MEYAGVADGKPGPSNAHPSRRVHRTISWPEMQTNCLNRITQVSAHVLSFNVVKNEGDGHAAAHSRSSRRYSTSKERTSQGATELPGCLRGSRRSDQRRGQA